MWLAPLPRLPTRPMSEHAHNLVTLEVDPDKGFEPYPGKNCGGCTACCRVVPVREMGVKAFQTCPMAIKRGCRIYAMRPRSCRTWSCSWLIGALPPELRPDRIGVVMDPIPDVGSIDGEEVVFAQFWAMPGHEEAWKKPLVSALIREVCDSGLMVLWRHRGPGGAEYARGFRRDPVTGQYGMSESSPSNDIGNEVERFAQAQRLLSDRVET